jgi:hypothetical protein
MAHTETNGDYARDMISHVRARCLETATSIVTYTREDKSVRAGARVGEAAIVLKGNSHIDFKLPLEPSRIKHRVVTPYTGKHHPKYSHKFKWADLSQISNVQLNEIAFAAFEFWKSERG